MFHSHVERRRFDDNNHIKERVLREMSRDEGDRQSTADDALQWETCLAGKLPHLRHAHHTHLASCSILSVGRPALPASRQWSRRI